MKAILFLLLAIISMSSFADCNISFNVIDYEGKMETDEKLLRSVTNIAQKTLKEKGIKIVRYDEADYDLYLAISIIHAEQNKGRSLLTESFALAFLENEFGELLFQTEKSKHAENSVFSILSYEKVAAKAVKEALKEIDCPPKGARHLSRN